MQLVEDVINALYPGGREGSEPLEAVRVVANPVNDIRTDYLISLDWGWAETVACTVSYPNWANGIALAIAETCDCSLVELTHDVPTE